MILQRSLEAEQILCILYIDGFLQIDTFDP
jgi:hypothetical protein